MDLAALKMAVRVDRQGVLKCDFHTALDVAKAGGQLPPYPKHPKFTVTSTRYYLADANFLVGLEGDEHNLPLLRLLDEKLASPVWPLYLGRKSFVPSYPVRCDDGLRPEGELRQVLGSYPWRPWSRRDNRPDRLRLVTQSTFGVGEPRLDVPISFADRTFAVRDVKTDFCPVPEPIEPQEDRCHVPE